MEIRVELTCHREKEKAMRIKPKDFEVLQAAMNAYRDKFQLPAKAPTDWPYINNQQESYMWEIMHRCRVSGWLYGLGLNDSHITTAIMKVSRNWNE